MPMLATDPRSTLRACAGLLLGVVGCAGAPLLEQPLEREFQRGVALGFVDASAESARDGALARALVEVGALGASDVSLLVPLYTESTRGRTVRRGALDDARGGDGTLAGVRSDDAPQPETSAEEREEQDAALRRAIGAARSAGRAVMIFPIVRLRQRGPGEWRGTLAPPDRDAWFAEYAREILALATLCAGAGVERLAIGSELVSFEDDPARWRELARAVRARFAGKILYSANWDRYPRIAFWDALDEIGISAYFSLAERGRDPSVAQLISAWAPIVRELQRFSEQSQRPVIFTEVGFPSVRGAAFWPWNDHQAKHLCAEGEGCEGALSMETQRRLWTAFVSVFSAREQTGFLHGAYVWLWSGLGGLRDRGYTPRGKPAESVLKLWYRDRNSSPPRGRTK